MNARVKALVVAAAALMALACGYQSGAERAEADVGPFGDIYSHDQNFVLTTAGEVWYCLYGWERHAEFDPPVPVFEIASWTPSTLVTVSGELWSHGGGQNWTNYGQVPGGVRVEESSFGAIKAKYGNH